jgi:hypothetical protein
MKAWWSIHLGLQNQLTCRLYSLVHVVHVVRLNFLLLVACFPPSVDEH